MAKYNINNVLRQVNISSQEGLTNKNLWFIVKMLDEVLKKHLITNLKKEGIMITINPIKLNNSKPISFGEGKLNNLTPNMAILSLQAPSAKLNFEKDYRLTQEASAVNANPILAIGRKFIKAYKMITNTPENPDPKTTRQISFMG